MSDSWVSRAMGVVLANVTFELFETTPPTRPRPMSWSCSPSPLAFTSRFSATVLPAPGAFVTCVRRTRPACFPASAAARAVRSKPPPGAVPTRIFSDLIC